MKISDTITAEAIVLGERLELIGALFDVTPNYRKWARDPLWTYKQALLLFMGHDPDVVDFDIFSQIDIDPFLKDRLGHKMDECEDIYRRLQLAKKAGFLGQLGSTHLDQLETPSNFLACAEQIELDVAEDLIQMISDKSGRPSYKKLLADQGEMAEALATKDKTIAQLGAKIRHLEENPFEFNEKEETYTIELDVAFQLWRHLCNRKPAAKDIGKVATDWLENSGYNLQSKAISRIATIANFRKPPPISK